MNMKSGIGAWRLITAACVLALLGSVSGAAAATANMSVGLSVSPPTGLGPGGHVTYTAIVSNGGPDAATNVSFTATLPAGIIPIMVTPDTECAFNFDGNMVSCSLGGLANGASRTVTIVVHPITIGAKTTTGHVSAAETDPNPANNTAAATAMMITEVAISEVQVSLFDTPDPLRVGQPLFYVAVVRNNGDDSAANVVVEVTIPVGTTFLGAVSDRGSCSVTGRRVACPIGGLNPSISSIAIIEVVPMTTGFIWASAGVSLTTPDPNPNNNSASARTWVNP
jgi:uncharacterized repeat protein (TIGR01451 family)